MLSLEEVAKHNDSKSCWVIVEGHVYDVTDFIDEHPGGASIILRYAGKDATEEYLPVHPPGTLEKELPQEKHLGRVDPASLPTASRATPSTLNMVSSVALLPIELCLCLDDFERAAQSRLSERGWTYYSSAAETLHSHRLNLTDWKRITFRPRVLRNVERVNMRCSILAQDSNFPFFIAPAALARLGHPDGELCLVRGAARAHIPYAVSTASSISHEELSACMKLESDKGHLFYQLYVKKQKSETTALIRRARQLGFKALIVTVDTAAVGKREEDDRYKARVAIEAGEPVGSPNFSTRARGVDNNSKNEVVFRSPYSSMLDWHDLQWIKEEWGDTGPLCLKGIMTVEDARMACENGFRSIYLSNHGGRQLDSSPSALRVLLELHHFYPDVLSRCEVILDGGVRRATDILKALCLGAKAVGLGRPFMYALSAYGTEGVERAIQILSDELETSMRLLGVTRLDELNSKLINTLDLDASVLPTVSVHRSRL